MSLAESVRLLEEAVKLKLEIEQELQAIENRLHELDLSQTELHKLVLLNSSVDG